MDEPDEKFQQSRMLHGSLFDDFWRLSQKEVPDGVSDIASLRPFVQKHLSDVRRIHAGHRKELREAEACHPTIFMTQQELSQLTTELYMGKLVLEINSYRAALAKLEAAVATDEDARLATESAHLKSVIAAQQVWHMLIILIFPSKHVRQLRECTEAMLGILCYKAGRKRIKLGRCDREKYSM